MGKKILVVCQRYWPENHKLIDICEGFVEHGYEVDVLCGQPHFVADSLKKKKYKKKKKEIRDGVKIIRANEAGLENKASLDILLNMISFRISSVRKLKEIENNGYDRIFIYQVSPVTMCAAGLKLGKQKGIQTTMFVGELWPHTLIELLDVRNELFLRFLYWLSDRYYKSADKLIVNSENTKKYFEKDLHISEEKIVYIPQSPLKIYEDTLADINLLERFSGSFNVVYTGEVGGKQGFKTLMGAAERIKKDGIKNIRYVVVGGGEKLRYFREDVARRGMGDCFFFEGERKESDIPKYLNMADVLLDARMTHDTEDYYVPSKLASYMASGRPLLLAMGGEAKKIVKEAGCGYVSDPDDDEALYINLKRLYKMSRRERLILGQNGKRYQLEHFDRNKNTELLLKEIYGGETKPREKYEWFEEEAEFIREDQET